MYNVEDLLQETVDSVLGQSYPHFKLILVDDASADGTKAKAQQIAKTDDRIVVLANATNGGEYKARNKALEYALKHAGDNDFVYILDSDDLLIDGGLAGQIEYMQNNPHIDVLGAGLQCFGNHNKTLNSYETDNDLIHMGLLYNSTTAHPATMIRTKIIGKIRYEGDYYYAPDYRFFTRLAYDTNAVFSSYQKTVCMYRMHANQLSTRDNSKQRDSADAVRTDLLKRMGIANQDIIQTHLHLCHKSPQHIDTPKQWADYATAMMTSHTKNPVFHTEKFPKFFVDKTIRNLYRTGKNAMPIYKQMPDIFKNHVSMGQKIKLYLSALRPHKK